MNWQSVIAIVIVAVAALWLIRRVVRTVRGGLRGEVNPGCGHCPKRQTKQADTTLVQLDKPRGEPRPDHVSTD